MSWGFAPDALSEEKMHISIGLLGRKNSEQFLQRRNPNPALL